MITLKGIYYLKGRDISRGGFTTGQPVWDPELIKNQKSLNELSPNTVSNTIDKYMIITFSTVNVLLGTCPEILCWK